MRQPDDHKEEDDMIIFGIAFCIALEVVSRF